jgi:tRNA pseudouridine38-40 synthase
VKNLFIGTHSFRNFTSKVEDQNDFVRTIYDIKFVEREDHSYSLIFEGSGFMMYQVRMMVANIVMAAIGKISLDEVKNLLNQKDRNITNYCYPPEGLYLVDVKY